MTLLLIPALALAIAAMGAALAPGGHIALARAALGAVAALTASVVLAAAWALGAVAGEGLAVVLLLLTAFVASVVLGFARRSMRADAAPRRFAATVALLAASVMAAVTSDSLLLFVPAWAISGLLLAQLIGHSRGWDEAKAAERRAGVAFAIGDAALFGALALLAVHANSLSLTAMIAAAPTLTPGLAALSALFVLIAAMARSALPPFDGWLLGSMTAPTPVSALMHAGLVNAGGFLLIRFAPLIEAAPVVQALAVAAGTVAALWGTGVALVRPDVKRALAGSTVAQMGFMILSCGMGAYAAALWHLVAHGLFKAWLFLRSGSVMGATSAPALAEPAPRAILAVGAVALAGGGVLVAQGGGAAELVPLLLASATAVTTALATLGGRRLPLFGLALALLGAHLGGLALVHAALAVPAGASIVAGPFALIVALPFLALWAWQARGLALPPALYARLLSAGVA